MAFWSKFNFTPQQQATVDSLLDKIPSYSSSTTLASSTSTSDHDNQPLRLPRDLSSADLSVYHSTLDALLAHPDLLSEFKSGSNARLSEFISHPAVVARLGGWVVWGLGREAADVPNGGIVGDDVADGKVPDEVVGGAVPVKVGMGGVHRRRNYDIEGVLEGGEPETDKEKEWAPFPRLSTEILSSENPSLGDALFKPKTTTDHDAPNGSTHPPDEFILPFWESLLGSTELQLQTRAVQVGYWARVNAVLLSGARGPEALPHILTIPHLLPRLLSLLPFCSPLNELLLLLLRVSRTPSPLIPSVVSQSLRMLDPFAALGKQGHAAAEELLRGVIDLCSAAPAQVQTPGQTNGEIDWRDNTLARQIAERKSVALLVGWMVCGTEAAEQKVKEAGEAEGVPYRGTEEEEAELRTSSLVQGISVLVDLIRKNNSDFVEQHMIQWARRKEGEHQERELLEADGAVRVDDTTTDAQREADRNDRGPALVDLGAVLEVLAENLPSFQELLAKPRSPHGPIKTTAGEAEPLTMERFRICELFAELLHCSNMGLLNRPEAVRMELFDEGGYLRGGWQGVEGLALALGPGPGSRQAVEGEGEGEAKPAKSDSPTMPGEVDGLDRVTTGDLVNGAASIDLNAETATTPPPRSASSLPPGPLLKQRFLDSGVIPTMLDLFFRFPNNNFLHNVVFDLLQQIFNGQIERALDRQLAIAVFTEGKLIDRILEGQAANDKVAVKGRAFRLGYMGHMVLIAEEVVKLFQHWTTEIYDHVKDDIPQPEWDTFVNTTLRETRERESNPLGGGVTLPAHEDSTSVHSALSDDDEFPMHSTRAIKAVEGGGPQSAAARSLESSAESGTSDSFSRYLQNAIAADRADKFASSDEDEDDEAWVTGTDRPGTGSGNGGGALPANGTPAFAFDDRFGDLEGEETSAFGVVSGGDGNGSDEEWGPFGSNSAGQEGDSSAFDGDAFQPTVTSATAGGGFPSDGFADSFASGFGDSFAAPSNGDARDEEEEDDFGDFETASVSSASITLPPLDNGANDFDFDFAEHERTSPHLAQGITQPSGLEAPTTGAGFGTQRPPLGRQQTADDGSAVFGGLGFEGAPLSPVSPAAALPTSPQTMPMSPTRAPRSRRGSSSSVRSTSSGGGERAKRSSMSPPPSPARTALAAEVITAELPLGPGVSEDAWVNEEGMVERELEDGRLVTAPADEIIMAGRESLEEDRLSLERQGVDGGEEEEA